MTGVQTCALPISFGSTTNIRSSEASFAGTGTKVAYLTVTINQIGAQFRVSTTSLGLITVTSASWERVAGNHATQSTSTARPTLQLSGSSYYLDFDGVDDRMVATFASVVNRPADIAIAWNRDVTASGYIYNGATSNGRLFLSTLNNPPRAIQIGNYDATTGAAGNWEDSATSGVVDAVVTARFTTTSPYRALRINGSAASVIFNAGASGGNSWDGITLGSSYTFGAYSNVNIYGYVGVNRNLTAGEIDDVEAYLAAKSGVTL